jgi:predicted Rdx family selenoprotein
LVAEILQDKELARQIESFALIPSDSGRFEFSVNDDLVFSKKKALRHANEGEILTLFKQYIEEHL